MACLDVRPGGNFSVGHERARDRGTVRVESLPNTYGVDQGGKPPTKIQGDDLVCNHSVKLPWKFHEEDGTRCVATHGEIHAYPVASPRLAVDPKGRLNYQLEEVSSIVRKAW